jgi:hypothetical protein
MKLLYGVGLEVTESFRWAMYCNPMGYGLNAQTSPKALRYFLHPPEGRIFVSGDLSQAEARVVAYEAVCKYLIEVFNDPTRNVHLENALAIFKKEVKKDTVEYTTAKSVIHASNYREGVHRFSVQAGISMKEARFLLEAYHTARPEIRIWHQKIYDLIRTTGKLINPLGDTRTFYEAISCFSLTGKMTDQHWKDAISWIPQSVVPHILDIGLLGMQRFRNEGMDLLFHHQGHDSFVCSIPIGEEQSFFDKVRPMYSNVRLASPGGIYTIPQEYSIGYSFGDMFSYRGSSMSISEWSGLLSKKLEKKSREDDILGGTYGTFLKDWRP